MEQELLDAGADFIGNEKILTDAVEGKSVFDKILATTQSVKEVKPFAKVLGPKGYMPSSKGGSLVKSNEELLDALKLLKSGQVEFK